MTVTVLAPMGRGDLVLSRDGISANFYRYPISDICIQPISDILTYMILTDIDIRYIKVESESESESECQGGIGVGVGTIRNRPSLTMIDKVDDQNR